MKKFNSNKPLYFRNWKKLILKAYQTGFQNKQQANQDNQDDNTFELKMPLNGHVCFPLSEKNPIVC